MLRNDVFAVVVMYVLVIWLKKKRKEVLLV